MALPLAVGLDDYTITIYPTYKTYRSFVTDTPRNICLVFVLMVTATALFVSIYIYLMKKWEDELKERIKNSYIEAKSRHDVLLTKKMYMRYMPHEMRTLLNVMHLGLRNLEKDLLHSRQYNRKKRIDVTAFNEVMGACDIAVTFLDELLNFGNFEDGFLTIKKMQTSVLSFIESTVKLLVTDALEKGVTINFDLGPNSDLSLSHLPFGYRTSEYDANQHISTSDSLLDEKQLSVYLSSSDHIDVDRQKMGQVLRSMIANAIKYSPLGGIVQLKARKIVRMNPTFVFEKQRANERAGNKLRNLFIFHLLSFFILYLSQK